jgi:hypothetical protein
MYNFLKTIFFVVFGYISFIVPTALFFSNFRMLDVFVAFVVCLTLSIIAIGSYLEIVKKKGKQVNFLLSDSDYSKSNISYLYYTFPVVLVTFMSFLDISFVYKLVMLVFILLTIGSEVIINEETQFKVGYSPVFNPVTALLGYSVYVVINKDCYYFILSQNSKPNFNKCHTLKEFASTKIYVADDR